MRGYVLQRVLWSGRLILTLYGVLSYNSIAFANNGPGLCDYLCVRPYS